MKESIITTIGFVIVISSWFITSWLNRKNEIRKVQIKIRFDMLLNLIDVFDQYQTHLRLNPPSTPIPLIIMTNLTSALTKIAFFGKTDEQELALQVFDDIKNNINWHLSLNKLLDLASKRIME